MNIENRTIFCHDNLDVLKGINSDCINLIYADPPFNKKKTFTAPVGSSAEGASFSDIFLEKDIKEEWLKDIEEDHYAIHKLLSAVKDIEGKSSYNFCYLAYMAVRLMECHRILKDTGSMYLHCDSTMCHYLKLLLDCIFGEKNFMNEIVWCYRKWANAAEHFQKNHDILLVYTKKYRRHFFEKLYNKNTPQQKKMERGYDVNVVQDGVKQLLVYDKEKAKEKIESGKYNRVVYRDGKSKVALQDWWEIPILNSQAKERLGYPTQKPLALLERIIRASSSEDDMVLDPFCGCATTCVAAERLKRKWIGIDVSVKAYELVKERLGKEVENRGTLFYEKLVRFNTDPPTRNDKDAYFTNKKYVYIISHPQYEGEYKVGIASDVKSRLGSYQTGDPDRSYKLEYSLHTPHFRAIENYIHKKYDNKREWVQGELKDIQRDIENYGISVKDSEVETI
ncbi:MAG: GIY-YIG nuclease family protein [Ekhidna sp.]|nr:GIY-YIG nuclease family protein [Ekhidna sp.]